MGDIYFLTGNENKLKEAREFIPEIQSLTIELTEMQSINPYEIIKHKLNEARKHHKDHLIVEDSSLYLESMNGLPGPLIKWFEKAIKLDGIAKLANLYGNKAIAKCIIGYFDGSSIKFFEGAINGKIVEPRGENGFGWDKIFIPDGYDKTFAEMTSEEKNQISMRKLAFQKLKESMKEKD